MFCRKQTISTGNSICIIKGPSADQLSLIERIRLAVSDTWMITLKFLENFVILLSVSLPYLALLTILVLITKTIIRRKKK